MNTQQKIGERIWTLAGDGDVKEFIGMFGGARAAAEAAVLAVTEQTTEAEWAAIVGEYNAVDCVVAYLESAR